MPNHIQETDQGRNLATLLLGGALFLIPLAGIWSIREEYNQVSIKIAGFEQENLVQMKVALIDKPRVALPPAISNLFALNGASPPPPTPPNNPPAVPPGPTYGDLFASFQGRIVQELNTVKLPALPAFDPRQIRVRGFYRKKKISQALVLFQEKLLLVTTGDKIGSDLLVERCDFAVAEISIRHIPSNCVHQLSVER